MDTISDDGLSAWTSSISIMLATMLVGILYYTSLPQAPIYGSFQRAGGTIFRWTAVHDVVAAGYKNVKIVQTT